MDLDHLSNRQLLELHCSLMAKLRERGVVRSSNNPIADYTESLVAKALGASLAVGSTAGFDAVTPEGTRIQIKGRRLTPENGSTQLSAIRNLAGKPFDVLAAVMFDKDLNVMYAALLPLSVVQDHGRYRAHTNAHTLHFRPALLGLPGVRDITAELRIVATG